MITALGWIGAICFSICGVPQVLKAYRTRSTRDLSWWFLGLWGAGEIAMMAHVVAGAFTWPLFINYVFCGVTVAALISIKLRRG